MTIAPRRRRRWHGLAGRLAVLVALGALSATLAAALHIRQVRVDGARAFPASEVEAVLRPLLGRPMLQARPEALRDAVRSLPWVDDARVRVSLDGLIVCEVTERTPVAVAVDGHEVVLLDGEGRGLGVPHGALPELVLADFGSFADERRVALNAVPQLETLWGAAVRRIVRLAPRDVAVRFADGTEVLVDPRRPADVRAARRVLAAWLAAYGTPPIHLDARVAGRVAVLPAPTPPPEDS